MDKIKNLLEDLGASKELSKSIISEMLNWKKRETAKLEEAFQNRLEKAKEICLEEFKAEKAQLARKVEVFLEAHVSKIDREAQRQAAIGESESAKTLRDMKCLLEGVPVDGQVRELQAVKDNAKRMRVKLDRALKECEEKSAEAKRANTIAMKAIARNKILESQNSGSGKTVSESRQKQQPTNKKPTNLRKLRGKAQEPSTTRKVLTESQVPAKKTSGTQSGDPNVLRIASEVDETPAFLNR